MRRRLVIAAVLAVSALAGAAVAVWQQDDPAPRAAPPTVSPTPTETVTPSASPTPSPSRTATPSPSPSPTPTHAATSRSAPAPSPARTYVVPPPDAAAFAAPSLVGTKLLGCRYNGNGSWTVTFDVTVRGGASWRFDHSNAQTMPYQFEVNGTTQGPDGTTVGHYAQQTPQWLPNPDGSSTVPKKYDEKVPWYAIWDGHNNRSIGVKLPPAYQMTAHCTR